ncbi:meiosis 1 arrest protein [Brachionichthys hirsutus]|uniref:meiosis 1 arrest protein n=1 Tax=Brachionichthys hirsutus TaxID=412623 RepID=UPI0036046BBB
MSVDGRKKSAGSPNPGNFVYGSSFLRQPARVLIVEALPPWWSETCTVVCDALDNFLSLSSSLNGPCRMPLFSLYAVSRQQECLLPFVQVRGNLARLQSCVEELRSISGEGCLRGARGSEPLQQAVLDSVQQFKQYSRHARAGKSTSSDNTSLEVTVMTSQSGLGVVRQLEMGLKDADLLSLKRLLVVQLYGAADWDHDSLSPEALSSETEDCLMLGTEVDLLRVENSVFAVETVLKAWLQEQGGDREHLHLLLPSPVDNPIPVCVKCDMQERLISPALIPLNPNLGTKTESVQDFLSVAKGSANQSQPPKRLKVIKTLHADGVCESVLYGLPLVIRPTTCWQLDWDEMEANLNLFHALSHTLKSRDWFLLLQVEPTLSSTAGGSGVCSHYVLQPSPSLSLLLKPVVSRELMLPCSQPVSSQDPAPDAVQTIQACLTQLDEEFVFNPFCLSSNLYQHLRSRGLPSQQQYPYRLQVAAARRGQAQPLEGGRTSGSRQRQPHNPARQLGLTSKAKATVAPLPSSSSSSSSSSFNPLGPPLVKGSRQALTLVSSNDKEQRHRVPAPTWQEHNDDEDEDDVSL